MQGEKENPRCVATDGGCSDHVSCRGAADLLYYCMQVAEIVLFASHLALQIPELGTHLIEFILFYVLTTSPMRTARSLLTCHPDRFGAPSRNKVS